MKVVVTGGSGQLGTLVLERLLARPEISGLVSLDVVPPALPASRVEWRIADLRDPGLERHLESADALVHLAFIVAKRASAATMRAVNVEGTRRLVEAAARHGVSRVVYTSSVAAYGFAPDHPVPIVEATPRRRTSQLVYADDKYDVEEFLDAFESEYPGTRVVRLRPGILLGRRVAHVSESFLERRLMPIVGDARGPLVWDEDVADAVVLALFGDVRGAFNVVAREPLPGEEVARLAGCRAVRLPEGAVRRGAAVARKLGPLLGERRFDLGWLEALTFPMIVSGEKARAELGWKPRHDTSAAVATAFGEVLRGAPDRRIARFFAAISGRAEPPTVTGPKAATTAPFEYPSIHVDVTGAGGGDFAVTFEKGVVRAGPGVPRPPGARLTASAETLLALLSGATDTRAAVASNRMALAGDPRAPSVLDGLVATLRSPRSGATAGAEPPRRGPAGVVSRWLGRSAGR